MCSVSRCRHLVVDGPTLAALGVFKEERHPSNMGIGVAKEGFSLFGLLNRCVSQMVSREGSRVQHGGGRGHPCDCLAQKVPSCDVWCKCGGAGSGKQQFHAAQQVLLQRSAPLQLACMYAKQSEPEHMYAYRHLLPPSWQERHQQPVTILQPSSAICCVSVCFLLFPLCHHSKGKRLLHTWFLRPMASLRVLTERHDAIDVMMAAAESTRSLQAALKKVGG
jgi:hypothetical protein